VRTSRAGSAARSIGALRAAETPRANRAREEEAVDEDPVFRKSKIGNQKLRKKLCLSLSVCAYACAHMHAKCTIESLGPQPLKSRP